MESNMLLPEQKKSFMQYIQRQTTVSKQLDNYFVNQRVFGVQSQYLIQNIMRVHSYLNLTVQETQSYIHGMVIAKKAVWIYQGKSVQAFCNQLGAIPTIPPINTPFRLI
jgi:hypothetical protein